MLAVLIVLAALGAAGWFAWQRWNDGTDTVRTQPPPCVTATPTPTPTGPAVAGPAVRVLNGSLRPGLAARAARELHRRFGLRIARVGNSAQFIRGAPVVAYPDALAEQARQVAAMLVPAGVLTPQPGLSRVEIDLGTRFHRVATPAEYDASGAASASPTPSASTRPAASPTTTPCSAYVG